VRSRGDNLAARDSEEISAIGGEAHCTPEPPPPRRQQPRLDDQGRLISGRLAGFSLWQAIWVLSWPILVESFLNSLVGLVDTILAAGLSEAATDAIGGASYILWFLSLIGLSVGIGATALVSRAVGGGKQAVANAALGQALLLSTVMGALVGVVVFAGAPLIAAALINVREGAGAEAGAYLDQARGSMIVYLRWAAAAVPMNSIMLTGLACCRAAGDAYRPLWTMLIVNGVNILVSWALAGVDLARTRLNDAGEAVSTTLVAARPSRRRSSRTPSPSTWASPASPSAPSAPGRSARSSSSAGWSPARAVCACAGAGSSPTGTRCAASCASGCRRSSNPPACGSGTS